MRNLILLVLAACASEVPNGTHQPTDPGPTDGGGGTTPPGAGFEVVAFDATSESTAVLTASLDDGSLALGCVRDDDPTEVHLVEASGAGEVVLRMAGLLHGSSYSCSAVRTDIEGPAATLVLDMPEFSGDYASADVVADPAGDMTGAYTLMNVRQECAGAQRNALTVLDPEGNNRWRHELPAGMNIGIEVVSDGKDRVLWGGGRASSGAPALVDVHEGPIWQAAWDGSENVVFHHDVNRLEDGRILSVEESDAPGWDAFQLRLIDENGETSWFWDVQQAVATGWLRSGSADITDPHHLNWADVVETEHGPVAYGSLCYDYAIIAIDVETGEPRWRFGVGGDFDLVDESGAPLDDDAFPQCQHGLQMDGTNLLVYDNGLSRGETRAVEYRLDESTGVATRTWEWKDEGFWEKYHGGVDWLTPDHTRVLVAEGNNDCGSTSTRPSQIVEIDRADGDREVHRLLLRDVGHWIYRAHRVDGCDLFANAKHCPAVATRVEELATALGW